MDRASRREPPLTGAGRRPERVGLCVFRREPSTSLKLSTDTCEPGLSVLWVTISPCRTLRFIAPWAENILR